MQDLQEKKTILDELLNQPYDKHRQETVISSLEDNPLLEDEGYIYLAIRNNYTEVAKFLLKRSDLITVYNSAIQHERLELFQYILANSYKVKSFIPKSLNKLSSILANKDNLTLFNRQLFVLILQNSEVKTALLKTPNEIGCLVKRAESNKHYEILKTLYLYPEFYRCKESDIFKRVAFYKRMTASHMWYMFGSQFLKEMANNPSIKKNNNQLNVFNTAKRKILDHPSWAQIRKNTLTMLLSMKRFAKEFHEDKKAPLLIPNEMVMAIAVQSLRLEGASEKLIALFFKKKEEQEVFLKKELYPT